MAFKMNGSPAKLGSIQGTAGHASALKQKAKTYDEAWKKNLSYQEDLQDSDNFGKQDQWGRKYEGSNVKMGKHTQEDVDKLKKNDPDTKIKVGDYKSGGYDLKAEKRGKADFKKAAEDWNMETYGTHNPTSAANKGGMTKKELAAQYKASKTNTTANTTANANESTTTKTTSKIKTPEVKSYLGDFHIDPNAKRKGLGKKRGKTITNAEKSAERKSIVSAKKNINLAKGSGDKDKRDLAQLEKAEIKSGRDNAKTGTKLSRWVAKRKVKRNKRQLTRRNTLNDSKEGTS